jgi:hypothetical protein
MKFFTWLITSSANPSETSLTAKAFLLGFAPILMLVTGMADADIKGLIEAVSNVIFLILSLVSVIGVIAGLLRKYNLGRWSA